MSGESFELKSPPGGLLTSLTFGSGLYATSFDGEIKYYKDLTPHCVPRSLDGGATERQILDSCLFHDKLYLATASGAIYKMNEELSATAHSDGVQAIAANTTHNLLVSGSWDKTAHLISDETTMASLSLPGKVLALDTVGNYAAFGVSSSQNVVYDLRNTSSPLLTEDTGFAYPLVTSLAMIPTANGYVEGSMEGKVSVNTFDSSSKYTFKAHRTVLADEVEFVGPIADIAFCSDTKFFTAGSNVDRKVCLWDYTSKKRVKQFKNFPMGVSKLAFDNHSQLLAIGMSDDSFKNSVSLQEPTMPLRDSVITVLKIC